MKIIDEACLDKFRQAPACEYCGIAGRGDLHPHHWYAKGMGGASRLDIRENLIALCAFCHQKVHDGNIPRHVILALIAVRMKSWPDQIRDMVHRLVRMPPSDEPPY